MTNTQNLTAKTSLMFAGKGIFIVAGVVILILIVGGIVLFVRSRTGDPVIPPPSGQLPGTGDLPPFGVQPPPPAAFPTAPSGPVDQAVQAGASVFAPASPRENVTLVSPKNPLIITQPTVSPPTISAEFGAQLNQEVESLPPGLRALYQKPGGPTEADLLEAEQKVQADLDALIAEITEFQNAPQNLSAASTTELCNKIIDDGRAFTAQWGEVADLSSFGQMTGGCVTQLPFGFPGI